MSRQGRGRSRGGRAQESGAANAAAPADPRERKREGRGKAAREAMTEGATAQTASTGAPIDAGTSGASEADVLPLASPDDPPAPDVPASMGAPVEAV